MVTEIAQEEVDDAIDYYLKKEFRAVRGFVREYEQALDNTEKYVSSMALYLHGTKRQLFASCPYQLILHELPDRIDVIAVAHLRRKPGYWRRRMRDKR